MKLDLRLANIIAKDTLRPIQMRIEKARNFEELKIATAAIPAALSAILETLAKEK